MKKFFMALCLILAFALGTLVPIANAFEIPSFVKDIKIYDVTENQVFLEIYGQIYVYDYLAEANNVIKKRPRNHFFHPRNQNRPCRNRTPIP